MVRDGRLVAREPFRQDPRAVAAAGSHRAHGVFAAPHRAAGRAQIVAGLARRGGRGAARTRGVRGSRLGCGAGPGGRGDCPHAAEHGPGGLFCGFYGWSSAGRLHHARSLIRRFYFAGGGGVDQVGNYSWGTAQFLLPRVIGTYTPLTGRVTSWPSIVAHTQVFVAFGGLALKNGQVSSGGAAEHTQEYWLRQLAAKGARVVNIGPTT